MNDSLNLLYTNENNWEYYYLTKSPTRIYVKVPGTVGEIFHKQKTGVFQCAPL